MPARDEYQWKGLTETQALREMLGEENLTDDRRADLIKATKIIKDRQSATALLHKVILVALYKELGTWDEVAKVSGVPKTTAWEWAHALGKEPTI
jgi:hypothetical protein